MRLRGVIAAAVLAAVSATPAARPALGQDKVRGAALAQVCSVCHGADGISRNREIPSLAGQQAGFITVQMILIREGLRNVPAMRPFAAGLADKDIEDLSAYFASLAPGFPPDIRPRDAAQADRGQALIGPRNCAVCHQPSLHGRDQVPRITSQREDWLVHAMTGYRDGTRIGADPQMNGAVVGLSDFDIAALAHFLAHRE